MIIVVVGVVIGVLISNKMVAGHFRKMDRFHWDQGFSKIALEKLNCTSEQEKQVKPILDHYSNEFKLMHKRHFAEITKMRQEMEQKLSTVVTEKQLKRLVQKPPRWTTSSPTPS